jgi:hypothetical protein
MADDSFLANVLATGGAALFHKYAHVKPVQAIHHGQYHCCFNHFSSRTNGAQ